MEDVKRMAQALGKLGGLKNKANHTHEYFVKIGKLGGDTRWKKTGKRMAPTSEVQLLP